MAYQFPPASTSTVKRTSGQSTPLAGTIVGSLPSGMGMGTIMGGTGGAIPRRPMSEGLVPTSGRLGTSTLLPSTGYGSEAYKEKIREAAQREAKAGKQEGINKQISASMEKLVSSYNQAYGQAKSANEARYQQLLGVAEQDYQRTARINQNMLSFADQTTGQRAADIRSGGAAEEANVLQRLRKLGMSGTTVAPTLRAGVRKETESSLNRLADTMQQTRLGVMGRMADQDQSTKLGIMERRTDAYPNQGMLSNLISSVGTGQEGSLLPSTLGAISKMRMS